MKIEFLMKDGVRYDYDESKFGEQHLEELLNMIVNSSSVICVELKKTDKLMFRRWVKAEDIKDVYVESDLPPEMELVPSVEVVRQDVDEKS